MIQHYLLGSLIFVSRDENCQDLVTDQEKAKIKNRFQSILDSFAMPDDVNAKNTHQEDNSTGLPYKTYTRYGNIRFGGIGDLLFLSFQTSYKEPLMFMLNRESGKVQDYMTMEKAKLILKDTFYDFIQEELHVAKNLTGMLKHHRNIDEFIMNYLKELDRHRNADTPTGYDCFEIEL